MNELFTKILTVMVSVVVSVWVSISVVSRRESDRKSEVIPVTMVSTTNYVTFTNYVTVTNFVSSLPITVTIPTNDSILSRGIPLPTDTQSVTVVSIDPPTTQSSRLRQISEELTAILEELKEKK
jgi:hypothetical protein